MLSINAKRKGITAADLPTIADAYTIKNASGIIASTQDATGDWITRAQEQKIPDPIIQSIRKDFATF